MGNTQQVQTTQSDTIKIRCISDEVRDSAGHARALGKATADKAYAINDPSGRNRSKIVRFDRKWPGNKPLHGDELEVRIVTDTLETDPHRGTLFVMPLPEPKLTAEEATQILRRVFAERGLQPKCHPNNLRVDLPGIHGEFCHMTRRNPRLEVPELQHGWFFMYDGVPQIPWATPIDVAPIPGVTVVDRASRQSQFCLQVTDWPAILAALGEPSLTPSEFSCGVSWSNGRRELFTKILKEDIGQLAPTFSNLRLDGSLIICTAKAFGGRWTVNELEVAHIEILTGELTEPARLRKAAQLLDPKLRTKMLNLLRASIRSPEEHLARRLHASLCEPEGVRYLGDLLIWLVSASKRFFTSPEELKNGLEKAERWIEYWRKLLEATPCYHNTVKDPVIYDGITPAHDRELVQRLTAESREALARIEYAFREITHLINQRSALRFKPEYSVRMWAEYERIEGLFAKSKWHNHPTIQFEFSRLQGAIFARLPELGTIHMFGIRVLAGLTNDLDAKALAAEELLQVYIPKEI